MKDFDLDKMYCGAIKRGDIFLVETKKNEERAVVVLQDDVLNEGLPTIVCAKVYPLRSGENPEVNEILIKKHKTGLGKDGICMLHKIETIKRSQFIAKKGELSKEELKEIFKSLDITLGRFRDKE